MMTKCNDRHGRVLYSLVGLLLAGHLTACSHLPQPKPEPQAPSGSTARPAKARARKALSPAADSGVLPLVSGPDALAARLALARQARHTLDLQYYIWHSDGTGQLLAGTLLAAAERGVKVRVLLDDLGVAVEDRTLLVLDSHPNIEVRLFNPVPLRRTPLLGTLLNFRQANRRMHNKSFTADGKVTIVGGRNIGDEYFGAAEEMNFADFDVAAQGPVVREASAAFDRYWNHPAAVPVHRTANRGPQIRPEELRTAMMNLHPHSQLQKDSPQAAALRSNPMANISLRDPVFYRGQASIVADDPDKIQHRPEDSSTHLAPQLREVVDLTKKELLLVSPYFIPGKDGVTWLRNLEDRGVTVQIITNSLASTDVAAVHAGYARYRKSLLATGVGLYEMKAVAPIRQDHGPEGPAGLNLPGSSSSGLHAKTFVFDRRWVFVGSLNLDPRSLQLNTEMGMLIDSPPLARLMAERMESHLPGVSWQLGPRPGGLSWTTRESGQTVRRTSEPPAGFKKVLMWRLASLLPLESQL